MNEKNQFPLPCIIYDHKCTLCERFKLALKKIGVDKRYSFASIHEKSIYEQYPELKEDECHQVMHLIDVNGTIYKGPDAITHLISEFPGVSKFSWLIESDMGKKTLDYFYSMVNKCRGHLINKCPDCK